MYINTSHFINDSISWCCALCTWHYTRLNGGKIMLCIHKISNRLESNRIESGCARNSVGVSVRCRTNKQTPMHTLCKLCAFNKCLSKTRKCFCFDKNISPDWFCVMTTDDRRPMMTTSTTLMTLSMQWWFGSFLIASALKSIRGIVL